MSQHHQLYYRCRHQHQHYEEQNYHSVAGLWRETHSSIQSDSESSCGEDDGDDGCSVISRLKSAPVTDQVNKPHPLTVNNAGAINSTNNDAPPSPWATGTTKQRIIDELKNKSSDIHLYYNKECTDKEDTVNILYSTIRDKYAPKHTMKNFRPNIKRLIESMIKKTGPFKDNTGGSGVAGSIKNIDPWFTSCKKISLGYTLLHDMYMFDMKQMKNMNVDKLWASHPQFKQYPLAEFKKYNKNMQKMVTTKMQRASTEEDFLKADLLNEPEKFITCRGTPFWSKHDAKKLLSKDIDNGIGKLMPPRDLWKKRKEYQEFPLDFFRKRIYEVRSKKLAAPYWQVKRNKNAMKLHRIETDRLRKEWVEGIELMDLMDRLSIGDE